MVENPILALAKVVLVLGIVAVHVWVPYIGVVTIPTALIAGAYLLLKE